MTTPRSQIIAVSEVAWQDRGSGVVATGNMNDRPKGATVLAVVWGRTEPV